MTDAVLNICAKLLLTIIVAQWTVSHGFFLIIKMALNLGAPLWLSSRVLVLTEVFRNQASLAALCCVLKQRNINRCFVLVQPRKTRPNITEKLFIGT